MNEYVFVTKDALKFGVEVYEVVHRTPKQIVADNVTTWPGWRRGLRPSVCFDTLDAAKADAIAQRDRAVASLESEIARLKAMTFDTVREG